MVDHFEISGVPGEYFNCPYGFGTLSVASCAKNFAVSSTAEARRGCKLTRCDGCEVGCMHAGGGGVEVPPDAGLVCTRCARPATRLIRGVVCVSCYNREREVLIGKNAKGKYPVKCKPIVSEAISYKAHGGPVKVRKMDRVTRGGESANVVLASEPGPIDFLWSVLTPECQMPHGPQDQQRGERKK